MTTLGIILMQIITMFQPRAIVATGGGGEIVAVEFGQVETRVRLHQDAGSSVTWNVPLSAYLSDEDDNHHALQRVDIEDGDVVLAFAPLPPTTRIFDMVGDRRHRWLGVHSAVRSLTIPYVRPKYDENAKIADSIEKIIEENSLEAELGNDSVYLALHSQLPQLRDYVVWKWALSPHEAFVLRQKQERPMPTISASSGTSSRTSSSPSGNTRTFVNSRMPQPRKSLFHRRPRPLSRFEQKTLQESRARGR